MGSVSACAQLDTDQSSRRLSYVLAPHVVPRSCQRRLSLSCLRDVLLNVRMVTIRSLQSLLCGAVLPSQRAQPPVRPYSDTGACVSSRTRISARLWHVHGRLCLFASASTGQLPGEKDYRFDAVQT